MEVTPFYHQMIFTGLIHAAIDQIRGSNVHHERWGLMKVNPPDEISSDQLSLRFFEIRVKYEIEVTISHSAEETFLRHTPNPSALPRAAQLIGVRTLFDSNRLAPYRDRGSLML
jgi:hypothetical protein